MKYIELRLIGLAFSLSGFLILIGASINNMTLAFLGIMLPVPLIGLIYLSWGVYKQLKIQNRDNNES